MSFLIYHCFFFHLLNLTQFLIFFLIHIVLKMFSCFIENKYRVTSNSLWSAQEVNRNNHFIACLAKYLWFFFFYPIDGNRDAIKMLPILKKESWSMPLFACIVYAGMKTLAHKSIFGVCNLWINQFYFFLCRSFFYCICQWCWSCLNYCGKWFRLIGGIRLVRMTICFGIKRCLWNRWNR